MVKLMLMPFIAFFHNYHDGGDEDKGIEGDDDDDGVYG